jgi:hypothetical protein
MTTQERLDGRRHRYLHLGVGELVAAVVFALVLPRLVDAPDRRALWAALAPLLLVLLQGGAYWLLARGWVGRSAMPGGLAALYSWFRRLDPVLLLLGLVGVLVWLPERPGPVVAVAAVWVFGVVEYVNYFVVRLAYPPARWWRTVRERRTPRLVLDLRGVRDPGPRDS